MPEMHHPVTGATAAVSDADLEWYESNGWQDVTPYDFKDNSWANVNPDANAAAEAEREAAKGEPEPQAGDPEAAQAGTPQAEPAQPQVSNTTAADPDAAGVKADAAPSEG